MLVFSPRLSFAQLIEFPVEVHLMKSLIIDMEVDFSVDFSKDRQEIITVTPELEEGDDSDDGIRPAIVRVRGGAAEALVDVETSDIRIENNVGEDAIKLYDFDIVNEDTGASVIVVPDSSEDSFLLSVGGKVTGLKENEVFTGFNILNLNYL
jgi:hypothetical protein